MQRFEDIRAWQKARYLVQEILAVCRNSRIRQEFVLRDQLCRATISAMSNIAEGFGRRRDTEFAYFLKVTFGSVCEVQSLLYVALDMRHISETQFKELYQIADEVASLTASLIKYLRKSQSLSR